MSRPAAVDVNDDLRSLIEGMRTLKAQLQAPAPEARGPPRRYATLWAYNALLVISAASLGPKLGLTPEYCQNFWDGLFAAAERGQWYAVPKGCALGKFLVDNNLVNTSDARVRTVREIAMW